MRDKVFHGVPFKWQENGGFWCSEKMPEILVIPPMNKIFRPQRSKYKKEEWQVIVTNHDSYSFFTGGGAEERAFDWACTMFVNKRNRYLILN